MNHADIHPTIREALAVVECLARLGYKASEVQLRLHPNRQAGVVLRVDERECSFFCGMLDIGDETAQVTWNAARAAWVTMTPEERNEALHKSAAYNDRQALLLAIVEAGFDTARWQQHAAAKRPS